MKRNILQSGFTLVELIVTIGIFTIMTSVVLTDYHSFNINADFESSVENIVLALRQAQVYGTGGKTAGITMCGTPASSFSCAYGVHFIAGSAGSYDVFVDANQNYIMDAGESIQTIFLGGNTKITSVTCVTSSGVGVCGSGFADVTFMRPSPDAFIAEVPNPVNFDDGVEITLSNGTKTSKVVISAAGQISIQ